MASNVSASAASIGLTTSLYYAPTLQSAPTGGTVPSGWILISQIKDLEGPEINVGKVDVTNMQSANAAKEQIPGMIDAQKLSTDIVYQKSVMNTLKSLLRTVPYWLVVFPDNSWWYSQGFISKLSQKTPVDGEMVIPLEVELTGLPVGNFT